MKFFIHILFFALFSFTAAEEKDDFELLMGKKTQHWQFIEQEKDQQFLALAKTVYERNVAALNTRDGEYKIPPVIHFIWLGPKQFPPQSVENVRTWIAENRGWKIKFWTDRKRLAPCEGMEVVHVSDFPFAFLKKQYHESENWGEKSDILRFEILYQEGGVYVDHDANCLKSFEGLHKGFGLYCGLEAPHVPFAGRNITCGNGVIGAQPGHPTIAKVIQLIAQRWEGLKQKFCGRDPSSKMQIVMHRTYIALTDALEATLRPETRSDIVLPSAYFFAKSGIHSLYSKHFYATSWDDAFERKSSEERLWEKTIHKWKHQSRMLSRYLLILIAFNLFLLALFVKKCVKK